MAVHFRQAGAVRLGISRVLEKVNPDFRSALKSKWNVKRDSRRVERKKYGQPGARKKPVLIRFI